MLTIPRDASSTSVNMLQGIFNFSITFLNVGDGKTHYIKEQMKLSSHSLTIAVNEAFTPLNAIKKLRSLSPSLRDCAIFLNFTMLPPGVSCLVCIGIYMSYRDSSTRPTSKDPPYAIHAHYRRLDQGF